MKNINKSILMFQCQVPMYIRTSTDETSNSESDTSEVLE